MILSTGMSNYKEIRIAVNKLKNCKVILLHCVSEYPTLKPNLYEIKKLSKLFKKKIGFSDHTKDIFTPALAVCMGAEFIEKHFTFNNKLQHGDHPMSLNPEDLFKMVKLIRYTEDSIKKNKIRVITEKEKSLIRLARKSIYLNKNLKKGERISMSDIKILRPQKGVKSEKIYSVLGKKTRKNIKAFQSLTLKNLKK